MAIEPHSSSKALQDLIEKLNGQGGGGISNHENLEGLLGGNSAGHYHLTNVQLQLLENAISVGNNHEALSGLLGGDANGHHHLTRAELSKLSGYPNFSSLNHGSLQGLLGGDNRGYYHLTFELLNKLINLPASGASGSDGQAATIQIGTVTTGAAGSYASVTNSGTSTNAIFNFVIPRGDKGDKGDSGSGSYTTITEDWTFTLENGSTVTKKVVLSS